MELAFQGHKAHNTLTSILHIQHKQQHGHPFVVLIYLLLANILFLNFQLCTNDSRKNPCVSQLCCFAISHWQVTYTQHVWACLLEMAAESIRPDREQPCSLSIHEEKNKAISSRKLRVRSLCRFCSRLRATFLHSTETLTTQMFI